MVSIGLAGGSIISLDPRTNVPHIGPQSAGSYPGPVCYDFGGGEPTITDVDLILGYLNPSFFLGKRANLNKDMAINVFNSKIAEPLGMSVKDATAMYTLANSMIYDLLHKTTIERGLDPRNFALFGFGGTAGMHVCAYADELEVSNIVIPYSASVHGAFGLMTSDIVHEEHVTHPLRIPTDVEEVNGIFNDLLSKLSKQLQLEGFTEKDVLVTRTIDMRYSRQVHILTVPVKAEGLLTNEDIKDVCDCLKRCTNKNMVRNLPLEKQV